MQPPNEEFFNLFSKASTPPADLDGASRADVLWMSKPGTYSTRCRRFVPVTCSYVVGAGGFEPPTSAL